MSEKMLFITVLWPLIAALICYGLSNLNESQRSFFVIGATAIELMMILSLVLVSNGQQPLTYMNHLFGIPLHLTLGGFRSIYALIASFMWLMTTLFSREYFAAHPSHLRRYYVFNLMTLAGTMGVFLSGNLWTTFVFFELMSFASYLLVIHDQTERAIKAANIYLAVGVLGGLVLLIGIFMMDSYLGTTDIALLLEAASQFEGARWIIYTMAACLLIGFGAKAGMFPLHFWLPLAHPVAPAPASALLSGILTKTGVYGLLIVSGNLLLHDADWGLVVLIFGTITMFLGAFRALFSNDLKKTLALSSVSQIGFILVGLGMQGILKEDNALAVQGTLLHMMNHSIIKLVLFMAAGAIHMKAHDLNLNTLQGYGRNKPWLKLFFGLGALSIMGVPLFSGYVSKTLLHESIVEYIWMMTRYDSTAMLFQFVEALFMLSGGFTVAYMTKLFVAIFVEKHPYIQDKHAETDSSYFSLTSALAIGIPAVALLVAGVIPSLMRLLAERSQSFVYGVNPGHALHFFSWVNIRGALVSIVIGGIVYWTFIRNFLMAPDEQGHLRYVDRSLGYVNYFIKELFKQFILKLFGGIQWLTSFIAVLPSWIATEIFQFHRG